MIQYKITKPCHQNWDAMSPTAQGKFCGHCQKQVYDLTNNKTVVNLPNSFCGRIESHKVAKEISFKNMLFKQNPFRFLAISLLLLFTKNAKAQLQMVNKLNFSTDSIPQQDMEDTITKTISMSGTLVDEKTGESIPFANLFVTDSLSNKIGEGLTDMDGAYNLMFDKALIHGKSISIMASYVGYDTIIVKNIPIISLKQNISIGRCMAGYATVGGFAGVSLMGGVVIVSQDPNPYYLHEENPEAKHYSGVFVSEFDNTATKRESISKNNDR